MLRPSPRLARLLAPTWFTCRPNTSSTASPGPMLRTIRSTRSACTDAASWLARPPCGQLAQQRQSPAQPYCMAMPRTCGPTSRPGSSANSGPARTARIVDDQIGSPTLADNLAEQCLALALGGAQGVYNTVGADVMDRLTFARLAAGVFGHQLEPDHRHDDGESGSGGGATAARRADHGPLPARLPRRADSRRTGGARGFTRPALRDDSDPLGVEGRLRRSYHDRNSAKT